MSIFYWLGRGMWCWKATIASRSFLSARRLGSLIWRYWWLYPAGRHCLVRVCLASSTKAAVVRVRNRLGTPYNNSGGDLPSTSITCNSSGWTQPISPWLLQTATMVTWPDSSTGAKFPKNRDGLVASKAPKPVPNKMYFPPIQRVWLSLPWLRSVLTPILV